MATGGVRWRVMASEGEGKSIIVAMGVTTNYHSGTNGWQAEIKYI